MNAKTKHVRTGTRATGQWYGLAVDVWVNNALVSPADVQSIVSQASASWVDDELASRVVTPYRSANPGALEEYAEMLFQALRVSATATSVRVSTAAYYVDISIGD